MSLFLESAWLEVMQACGTVSGQEEVTLENGRVIHVGVARGYGQARWLLFGSWEEESGVDLEPLLRAARQRGAFQVESRFNMARWQEEQVSRYGVEQLEPFGTYQVDLTQNEETLWQRVHGKHRNGIRRARDLGVTIQWELDRERFLEVMEMTYQRGNRSNPFRRDYFQALFGKLAHRMLTVQALWNGAFQAGAVIPFDRRQGYYLHGATIDAPVTGAANLLQWEVMRELQRRGVTAYDLGGARLQTDDPRLQGIFRFKERFGGAFVPCCHWQKVVNWRRATLHSAAGRIDSWWKQHREKHRSESQSSLRSGGHFHPDHT